MSDKNELTTNIYSPTELILLFKDALAIQNTHAKVICMKGIYKIGPNPKFYNYDVLYDELTGEELTVFLTSEQKTRLKNGSMVLLSGILERQVLSKGLFKIFLRVTRIETLKEDVVTNNDIRLYELHKQKQKIGFKEVETIIKDRLYLNEHPTVALLYAGSSIVNEEFEAALTTAKVSIDFTEFRVSFAQVGLFNPKIEEIDLYNFDVIAIIRGGGTGIEFFDNPDVLETIVKLSTPVISAVGHKAEKFYLKEIADKVVDTPTALGVFFRDIVEQVAEQRSKSKAVLASEIKKQYQEQIDIQIKQNNILSKQIKDITEVNKDANQKHNAQITMLQNQLKEITANNVRKDENSNKQINDLTLQIRSLIEARKQQDLVYYKQIESLNKQLEAKNLELNSLKNKNSGCFSMVAVFVGVIIIISILI